MGVTTPSRAAVTPFVNNLTADSYIGIASNGRLTDRVIMNPQWEPDMSAITVTLRPNLKFHDGTPVDLAIFKEALTATLKAAQPQGTNVTFKSVTGVELVAKKDGTTEPDKLRIRLSRPEAFFLEDLANQTLRKPGADQIATGPFQVVSSEGNVKLKAYKEYYRGTPKITDLEIQHFAEARAAWAALARKDIEAVSEMLESAIVGQSNVKAYPFVRPYYYQLLFNVRNPVLKNPGVRQALSYAIDRKAVVEHALSAQGMVAEGPIWPFHWAYSTAQKVYTHNSDSATVRLDSAGFKVKKAAQAGQMPSRFRIRCLVVANNAQFEKIALMLAKQFSEIGVDLAIETETAPNLMARLEKGDFDTVLVTRSSGRSLAWTYLSFHSSESPGGYSAADKVLEMLRRTTEEAAIRAGVSDLQQILHDDPPAIFIAWPKVARVVSARFEVDDTTEANGRDSIAGRDVLSTLWQWKPIGTPPR
jgi:ABC-type transport system substrate-binding protein